MLSKLAEIAELSLPIGDLERGADEDASQVNELVGKNPDVQRTVEALERHYDAMLLGSGPSLFGSQAIYVDGDGEFVTEDNDAAGEEEEPTSTIEPGSAEEIGDAIERYLRSQLKIKPSDSESPTDDTQMVDGDENPDDDRPQPRHRAPNPWEG